ncbi:MAG: methylated-DNA--[protein]-cysteine S-methyltransferase [Acidimicrobiia bacterium]|nr:methylated-DNA--[protein]-cysteine S-methyltransferase [Acidimicrobiia bacterium]
MTGARVPVIHSATDTPIGPLLVAATPVGLVRVAFAGESWDEVLADLARRFGTCPVATVGALDQIRCQFDEYFAGQRRRFSLPIHWWASPGFRRTARETLYAKVDFGHTVSYLELATMAGRPKASRAVGSAMATNPIPIVVPCHRVVRSSGHLGGYRGGLSVKAQLLELEAGA